MVNKYTDIFLTQQDISKIAGKRTVKSVFIIIRINKLNYIFLNFRTLPQPIDITAKGQAFDILPNNTLVSVTKYAKNNFTVITSDFPKSPIEGGKYSYLLFVPLFKKKKS
jgi:hypothetical protein